MSDARAGGTKVNAGGIVEYYLAKDSMKHASKKNVIICYPDVWGWNSGRVRRLADYLASSLKCAVCVPKLQPPLEGGTDDDALPPSFNITAETRPKFLSWIKKNGTETFMKRNDALIADLKKRDFDTFFAVGFCWGGWASFRCASRFPSLLSAILIYHPSVQLEAMFGGSPTELASKVTCPVAFHVCGNDDKKFYDEEEGELVASLRKNGYMSSVETYPDMLHGFMTRGDASKPEIRRDIGIALERGIAFIKAKL